MSELCFVCRPAVRVIRASMRNHTVTLDAEPHPAGLFIVATVNGWVRASKIAHDQSPGTANRHRLHIHRTEGNAA